MQVVMVADGMAICFDSGPIEDTAINEDVNGDGVIDENDKLTSATVYYYSETEPAINEDETAYDGNYWHFVEGEIVIWVKETV